MRGLVVLALAACTSSHSLRVRAVDGLTGRPLSGERLTVKTFLTSDSCEHEERSKPWPFGVSEGTSADTDIDNTQVSSGPDGWTTIQMIDARGACGYRPTKVEVYVRGVGDEIDLRSTGPVFVPVFFSYPRHDSGERTYTTYRAKDAFTPIEAARSVYEERFVRVTGHAPTAFASADTILVGSTPEIHADGDGDDPFVRVALAEVTPSGTAWRIVLTALALSPTTPQYIVPPGYESQRAQLEAWARSMLDEVVLRAATAAKLIDRHYLETNEWEIVTRVDGATVIADILHDENPYDHEPAKRSVTVRGTLARRDGRVVVDGLAPVAD